MARLLSSFKKTVQPRNTSKRLRPTSFNLKCYCKVLTLKLSQTKRRIRFPKFERSKLTVRVKKIEIGLSDTITRKLHLLWIEREILIALRVSFPPQTTALLSHLLLGPNTIHRYLKVAIESHSTPESRKNRFSFAIRAK